MYCLVNRDMQTLDRVVIKGKVCKIESVTHNGIFIKDPETNKSFYRNINRLREECSFAFAIIDRET